MAPRIERSSPSLREPPPSDSSWFIASTRLDRSAIFASAACRRASVGDSLWPLPSTGPPKSAHAAISSVPDRMAKERARIALLHDLDAAVLLPGRFVVAHRRGPLFAVADDAELAGRHALELQGLLHRARAALAERDVVLARAALVGVAFEAHPGTRVLAQVLRPVGDHRLRFSLELARIEIEIDDVLVEIHAAGHVAAGGTA